MPLRDNVCGKHVGDWKLCNHKSCEVINSTKGIKKKQQQFVLLLRLGIAINNSLENKGMQTP